MKLDGRFLSEAQQRVNLASKIVSCEMVETRAKKNNKWFEEAAKEAGFEMDDDMIDEGLAGGNNRDQQKLREAKAAQSQLEILLSRPMVTQRFLKFQTHSNVSVSEHITHSNANASIGAPRRGRRRRRRR